MNTRQRAAACFGGKSGGGTLLGSAVPLFAPSTVLAAVGGLRKGAWGRRLCFLGGRCRRCGLQGPASELVGVAAADAAVRVTRAPLGEVAQRRSSPSLRRRLFRGALDTPLARRR